MYNFGKLVSKVAQTFDTIKNAFNGLSENEQAELEKLIEEAKKNRAELNGDEQAELEKGMRQNMIQTATNNFIQSVKLQIENPNHIINGIGLSKFTDDKKAQILSLVQKEFPDVGLDFLNGGATIMRYD